MSLLHTVVDTASAVPVLSNEDVARLFARVDPERELTETLERVRRGLVTCAPRVGILDGTEGHGTYLMMAKDRELARVVTKLVDDDPSRPQRIGRPGLAGLVTYMVDGRVLFAADSNGFTALRTAAVTAFALRRLAPRPPRVVVVVGAGPLGRAHVVAIARTAAPEEIRLVSRSGSSAAQLASELQGLAGCKLTTEMTHVHDATEGADAVIAVTTSVEPIVRSGDVRAGMFVASVGSGAPQRRELEGEVLARADRIIVETADAAWAEAGDLIMAEREGLIDRSRVTELADVLRAGSAPGPDELVVYKSVGASWEDLAFATAIARLLGLEP